MARALKDILTELDAVYKPQKDLYATQASALDPALQAEEQGLQQQKQDSFQQITDQANRRGLFYSGIPIAEEQKYVGGQFLPAIANLRSKYSSQRFGLHDAIAKITADQYGQGMGIWQKELDRDEEARRFNEQLAAQERSARASAGGGGGFSPGFGGGGGEVLGAQKQMDPVAFAQFSRSQLERAGNVQPFAREGVRDELMRQYGMSQAAANEIVYKQVFPDTNWGKKPAAQPMPAIVPAINKAAGFRY